jgi:phosphatidylglycerophosphate synthase
MYIATLVRLAFIPAIWIAIQEHAPYYASALVVCVAFLDLWDGQLARRFGVESIIRRVLDATVDRALIHACFLAFTLAAQFPYPWIVLFLRDTVQAFCNIVLYRMTRRIACGGTLHRIGHVATAIYGIALLTGAQFVTQLGIALTAVVSLSLATYLTLTTYYVVTHRQTEKSTDARYIRFKLA